MAGLLGDVGDNLLGLFKPFDYSAAYTGSLAKDPTTGQADPAVVNAFRQRAMGAAAEAFAQGGMPVPYKGGVPLLSTIGMAGGAASRAGDPLIAARLQSAEAQNYLTTAALNQQKLGLYQWLGERAKDPNSLLNGGTGAGGATGNIATGGKALTPANLAASGGGGQVSAQQLYSFLTDNGANKNEATAITSGMMAESGGNPDTVHDAELLAKRGLPPGYGLFGDNGTNLTEMRKFAGVGPNDPVPWQKQALFALQSLRPGGIEATAGNDIRNASNPEALTQAQLNWLRPANYKAGPGQQTWGRRLASTSDILSNPPYVQTPPEQMYDPAKPPTQTAAAPGAAPQSSVPTPGMAGVPAPLLDAARNAPTGAGPLPPEAPPAPGGNPPSLLNLPDPSGRAAQLGAAPQPNAPPIAAPPPGSAPPPTPGPQSLLQQPPPGAPPLNPNAQAILAGMNAAPGGGGQVAGPGAPSGGLVPGGALTAPPPQVTQGPAPGPQSLLQQPPTAPPAGGPGGPQPGPPATPGAGAPGAPPAPASAVPGGPPPVPPPGIAPPQLVMPGAPPPTPAPGPVAGAPSAAAIKEANQLSTVLPLLGIPVPPNISEIAKYPMVGPTAAAQAAAAAAAKQPYELQQAQAKAAYDLWVARNKPEVIREGGMQRDPATGQMIYNPPTMKTVDQDGNEYAWHVYPSATPGGVPQWTYLGQTKLGPQATKRAEELGAGQGKNAPLPPTAPTPQPGAPPTPAYGGTQLAPNMMSKQPDYAEPQYTSTQLADNTKRWGEQNQAMAASIGTAQSAEQRMMTIANMFQQVKTGAFTTDRGAWNNALNTIFGEGGGGILRTSVDPGAVYTALHETYRSTLQNLKALNPRFANAEFQGLSKMSENPDLPPEANLNMLAEDIAQLRQQRALAQDWVEARVGNPQAGVPGKQDPEIYETKWLRMNPLDPIRDAVKQEIGVGQLAPPPPAGSTGGHPPGGYQWDQRSGRIVPKVNPQ